MSDRKWRWLAMWEYGFVDECTGEILGRVLKIGGTWRAFTQVRPAGEYMTRDRAQQGVERALFYAPATEEP